MNGLLAYLDVARAIPRSVEQGVIVLEPGSILIDRRQLDPRCPMDLTFHR